MPVRIFLLAALGMSLSWSPLAAAEPDWLAQRCRRLLEIQFEVHNGLGKLHQVVAGRADRQPRPEDRQAALPLVDRLNANITEMTRIIHRLEAEGVSVAFPEVLRQVRAEMRDVRRRLERGDVGAATQALEWDILDTLDEMIRALRRT
jgi:hypothetical protein